MDLNIKEICPITMKEKEGSALLWRKEDEKFILLARHDMYVMNEFSKEIFDLCDGTRSIIELIEYCVEKYSVDFENAKNSITKLINFAIEKKLMELGNKNDRVCNCRNNREV